MDLIVKWTPEIKLFGCGEMEKCFRKKQIMFIGDSKVRQVFMTLEGMLDDHYILYDLGGHNDFFIYRGGNETTGTLVASFIWDVSPSGPGLDGYLRKYRKYRETAVSQLFQTKLNVDVIWRLHRHVWL